MTPTTGAIFSALLEFLRFTLASSSELTMLFLRPRKEFWLLPRSSLSEASRSRPTKDVWGSVSSQSDSTRGSTLQLLLIVEVRRVEAPMGKLLLILDMEEDRERLESGPAKLSLRVEVVSMVIAMQVMVGAVDYFDADVPVGSKRPVKAVVVGYD